MFQIKVAEKIKTHISCSITLSRKSCPIWDDVEKYGRVGEATDDNMILHRKDAISMPDN
jgi:hypothetical protein